MTTKLKFNKKVGKKILALLLSVLTVFTCITPVMSALADSSIKDVCHQAEWHIIALK